MAEEKELGYLTAKVETIEGEMIEMRRQHAEMLEQLTKYKGFIGGMIFLWSCIWAAILGGWEVWSKFIK